MVQKAKRVNQGDLRSTKTAFIPDQRGEEPGAQESERS
jgi:hypothetical protein